MNRMGNLLVGCAMALRNYRDLEAWQKGMDLLVAIYRFTELLIY